MCLREEDLKVPQRRGLECASEKRTLMSELERTRVLCDEDFLCVGEGLDKVLLELELG